jgi:hypothetical protein
MAQQTVETANVGEILLVSTGNMRVDSGLVRLTKKIDKKENFGKTDYAFIDFLLREKLACEECCEVMSRLYLRLLHGKSTLSVIEYFILAKLQKNKRELKIPEVQMGIVED